jgi:hypothetical protein
MLLLDLGCPYRQDAVLVPVVELLEDEEHLDLLKLPNQSHATARHVGTSIILLHDMTILSKWPKASAE